ncbi:MAG: metallophosphoesterase [Muribaculaceae bacterium]|nr:metallophosphoesterase [Muribaculaceae bacterium]
MRLPLVFIIILLIVAIVVDFLILKSIDCCMSRSKRRGWKIFSWILMALGYGLIVAIFFIPVRNESANILPVMWLLFSFLSIYIPKIIYLLFWGVGELIAKLRKKTDFSGRKDIPQKALTLTGLVLAVATFFMFWFGVFFTRRSIEVNTEEVVSSRIPASFNNYKIVQFSDAHVGTWGEDTTFVSALVEKVNGLNPDLIVFTGDIVNRRTDELRPFLRVLSRLKARDGVYSVLGNHDYGDYIDWKKPEDREINNRLLAQWEKKMGWHLLNNEHVFLRRDNDSIVLIGVENWGEAPFPEYGKLREAYPASRDSINNLNDERFKVLLTHNPEHWSREVLKISNIDLSLSGHTHAMQMMVSLGKWKWSPSKFKYSRWGGMYEEKNPSGYPMMLYVNIGTGEVGLPTRMGSAYPEITEFILKHK